MIAVYNPSQIPSCHNQKMRFYQAKHAKWETPADVKQAFQTVSVLPNNRLVFNIKGSKYQLVVLVLFSQGKLFIRFVGTHAEYDRIDATKI